MRSTEPRILLAIALIGLCLPSVHPLDRTTWILEVFPVLVALPLLAFSYGRFPLTPLLYRLLFLHALLLLVGGHYTYARVPLGTWLQQAFDLGRNHFDRIGHFVYELIEWWPAVVLGDAATDFLGTLGYPVGHVPGPDRCSLGTTAALPFP